MAKQETNVQTETKTVGAAAPAFSPAPAIPSKASKANAIFMEMFQINPRPARKDMIARAVDEAGLTQAGAATYLQNFKAKNGLTVKKS